MEAFVLERHGRRVDLQLRHVAEPEVGESDVLVEIHAAGVNPLDNRFRNSAARPIGTCRPPSVLGNDLAGVVVRVGAGVRGFKPGDEVMACTGPGRMGAFAEVIAVPEAVLAMKPRNLSMEEAASIPLVGLAAWQALVERAGLQRGQRVLIHAGSGGVGTMAIQLAKHLGATVATTTSTRNVAFVKRLGADIVIDYTTEDFETSLRDFDVVLDTLGGRSLQKSLRVLRPGGQAIGLAGPRSSRFVHRARRRNVSYSFLSVTASGEHLAEVTSLIEAGTIRPVVDRLFPLKSTERALAYVGTGRARGKVVIYIAEAEAELARPRPETPNLSTDDC